MNILIVDGSPQIIERLKEMFYEVAGVLSIYTAIRHKEAIRIFTENAPDIVLLDINFSGICSPDLLKEFKSLRVETPVIILTNCTDNEIKQKCKSLGADFFFDKYYHFEKIPAVLEAMINTKNKIDK